MVNSGAPTTFDGTKIDIAGLRRTEGGSRIVRARKNRKNQGAAAAAVPAGESSYLSLSLHFLQLISLSGILLSSSSCSLALSFPF